MIERGLLLPRWPRRLSERRSKSKRWNDIKVRNQHFGTNRTQLTVLFSSSLYSSQQFSLAYTHSTIILTLYYHTRDSYTSFVWSIEDDWPLETGALDRRHFNFYLLRVPIDIAASED